MNAFDTFMKWILALIFLPPLLCGVLQIVVAYLNLLLPMLVVIAGAAGLAAGVGAALANGRRPAPRRISGGAPHRAPILPGRGRGWR